MRIEDDASSLWIYVEIELRGGRDISSREGAAHHGNTADHSGDFGIAAQDRGDIGQRAQGDDGDFTWIFADDSRNNLVGGLVRRFGGGHGEFDPAQTVI